MQQFLKDSYNFFLILTLGVSLSSCDFFGLDKELDHFTIENLVLTSNVKYIYLTPPNVRIEKSAHLYSNTRDSVFRKLQTEYSEIKTVSFYRMQLGVTFPTDSSLVIIDSIDVYLANTLNQKTRVGYLHDLPANLTDKTLDLIIAADENETGNIMKADTAFFKTDIYLRSTIRSDSMVFQISGEYNIRGDNK